MKRKNPTNKYYKSRFTMVENSLISSQSLKKSKTHTNKLNKKRNLKKKFNLKQEKKNESQEVGSSDIQDIFSDIMFRLNNKKTDHSKKIKFEKNGSLKVISESKESNSVKSKVDFISDSLGNNYWPCLLYTSPSPRD